MEKVFINCNRLVLGLENIPLDIRQNNSSGDDDIPHLTSLAELEMQAIEHTCRVCEWNLTKAAEVLKLVVQHYGANLKSIISIQMLSMQIDAFQIEIILMSQCFILVQCFNGIEIL